MMANFQVPERIGMYNKTWNSGFDLHKGRFWFVGEKKLPTCKNSLTMKPLKSVLRSNSLKVFKQRLESNLSGSFSFGFLPGAKLNAVV